MDAPPDLVDAQPLIIACLEDHAKAIMVLHAARRRAQELRARWIAVHIEASSHPGREQERLLRILTLAEQMGAEVIYLQEETVESGIEALLQKEKSRVALLVIGSEGRKNWWELRRDISERIISMARRYTEVDVVPLMAPKDIIPAREQLRQRLRAIPYRNILQGGLAIGLAYLGATLLQWVLPPALFRVNMQNVGLLFMIACAFVAGRYGLWPGLIASAASFFIVNYHFTQSYHDFAVVSVTDALNMAIFLFAAVLISLFTSQTRTYAENAFRRESTAQALFTLYRIASDASSRRQALEKLQGKLAGMLETEVAFFLPPAMNLAELEPAFLGTIALEEGDRQALQVCWQETKTTGIASPFNPGTTWRFEPMIAPGGPIGVLGIRPRAKTRLDAWFGRLLTAIANQTAAVIERIEIERSMEATRISEEREKLRSMLLSSVSHDLKTPLSAIIGSLSVWRSLGVKLTPAKQSELIETALEEAQRLDSFITNILDMTRLESGEIEFKPEWQDMSSLVQQVTHRLQSRLRQHPLTVHKMPEHVEIYMDVMLTGQVLMNILDNACKYTAPGTGIELSCTIEGNKGFCCKVRDHGKGLPVDNIDCVFDKYARLQKKDTQVAGTGLGLAICKAIMEMQGGSIRAENHPDGGAVFTLSLPQWRATESRQYVA